MNFTEWFEWYRYGRKTGDMIQTERGQWVYVGYWLNASKDADVDDICFPSATEWAKLYRPSGEIFPCGVTGAEYRQAYKLIAEWKDEENKMPELRVGDGIKLDIRDRFALPSRGVVSRINLTVDGESNSFECSTVEGVSVIPAKDSVAQVWRNGIKIFQKGE